MRDKKERDPRIPASAVLTIADLHAMRARYLQASDVLDRLPGVDVRDFGGPGQPRYVQLRGASPQQVLVLADGVRLNPILGGGADLSMISVGEADHIEVLRGPAAAAFGADGLGGVVRFVRDERPRSELQATAGSFETFRLVATVAQPHVRGGFHFESTAGNFRTLDAQRSQIITRDNNHALTAGLHAAVRVGGVDVRARGTALRGGSPGAIEFPTPRAKRELTQGSLSAQWRRGANGVSDALTIAAHERYEHTIYRNPEAILGGGAHETQSLARGSGAEVRWHTAPTNWWALGLSGEGRWERLVAGNYGTAARSVGSLQAGSSFLIGQHVEVGTTARLEVAERVGGRVLPSAGVAVNPLAWLTIRANAGRLWRLPSFLELYHPDLEFVAGNRDLVPEDGWTADAGVVAHTQHIQVEATLFSQWLSEAIVWAPVSAFRYQPVNTGASRVEGLELAAAWTARHGRIRVMATRIATLRQETGEPLPARPTDRASVEGTAHWRWARVFGEVTYTGDSFADFHGNLIVPGGTLVGAGASVTARGTTVTFETKNLFNANLRDARYFPLPGRAFYVTLLWER